MEMGSSDVLATIRGPKLEDANGAFGLTTYVDYSKASAVMLSNHTPNISIKQFMTYISNSYNMHSIVLQCFPVKSPALKKPYNFLVKSPALKRPDNNETCKCIVFNTVEDVAILLAAQIPGTLKRMSDSLFQMPSLHYVKNGYHECS